MRHKAENSVSKNKILLEAFKLFASKPFEKVTFADLEKATGLSRGAILYHIQTKENLFEMVLENLIFKRSTIVSNDNIVGLWNHIEDFIQERIKEQEDFSSSSIANVNKAFFNIECSAFSCSDKMADFALSWVEKELASWIKLLNDAIAAKEIKSDIDIVAYAHIFMNIFMGASYIGIGLPNGYDIENMKKQYRYLYDQIKI